MANILDEQVPRGWAAATDFEVVLPSGKRRSPDFAIVTDEAATANRAVHFSDVLLLGEVVSPSSIYKDIYQHPKRYLTAGLIHYWHIHLEPVFAIYAHRLGTGQVEHHTPIFPDVLKRNPGRFIFAPEQPLPFQIDLARLVHTRTSFRDAIANKAEGDEEADHPAAEVTVKVDRVDGVLVPLAKPGALLRRKPALVHG